MNIIGRITRKVDRPDTAATLCLLVGAIAAWRRFHAPTGPKGNESKASMHCSLTDRFHSDLQPYPRHAPISGASYQAAAGTLLPIL